MSAAEGKDRALRRLEVVVAHLIEHMADHGEDLAAGREALVGDGEAVRRLDAALADLARAQGSLSALYALLGSGTGAEPATEAR